MDFADDDEDDDLMLAAVETYETQANKLDESVKFVGSQQSGQFGDDHQEDEELQPEEQYLLALKENFGHNKFRPLQWKIIRSILVEKRDCCAIMTTGYGKSLCYQYPSVYTNGVTLVISPLISLMEDQVLSLSVLNIKACFLGTAQKEKIFDDIVLGLYRVVYLTPEYITGDTGTSLLRKLAHQLTLVAIDEAHCVSSWGHDFRSAFRALSCIRSVVPDVPMMALTATATKSVLDDIVQVLQLKNPRKLCSGFDRPNLKLMVRSKFSPWRDLQRFIRAHQDGSVIIYCLKRTDTENMVKVLSGQGVECAAYHAGLSIKVRRTVHENFVRDKLRVIVATVAFGMGIDKPDVRCVINYGASREIESYYQEIGRAGRDGQQAHVITFYSRGDFEFHSVMRQNAKSNAHRDHLHALNRKFQEYLETPVCRRKYILAYFGDPFADKLIVRPNCCDNCDIQLADPNSRQEYEEVNSEGMCDFAKDTQILLQGMETVGPFYGLGMSILFVRGSNSKKIPDKLARHPLRGSGSGKTDDWWKYLYDLLERLGFVQSSIHRPPSAPAYMKMTRVSVTVEGKRWLNRTDKDPLWLKPKREMFQFFRLKRKEEEGRPLLSLNVMKKPVLKLKRSGDRVDDEEPLKLREKTYEEEFRKRLLAFRMGLANDMEVMPYMVVSEKCLQQMAERPPTALDQLSKYDGMSLAKVSLFGGRFINFIRDTVEKMKKEYPDQWHNISTDAAAGPSTVKVHSPSPAEVTLNSSILDNDEDDAEILLLEQAVFKTQVAARVVVSPSAEPPKKKKLLDIQSAVTDIKYDNSDSSDGDDMIAAVPSTQNRGGWLSTRANSQSSSQERKGIMSKKPRTIKSIW